MVPRNSDFAQSTVTFQNNRHLQADTTALENSRLDDIDFSVLGPNAVAENIRFNVDKSPENPFDSNKSNEFKSFENNNN